MRAFWKMRWTILVLVPLLLSGCLLTLGAPLARRVEPGRWVVEAGAGPRIGNEYGKLDGQFYAYAGRALGRHFELGLLPYFYTLTGMPIPAVAAPVRWDPFPYVWPIHWVIFAGPTLFLFEGVQVGATMGTGLSLQLGDLAELYLSGSTLVPGVQFVSAAGGVRFDLKNGFQIGIGAMFSYPGLVLINITGSTLLGKPLR